MWRMWKAFFNRVLNAHAPIRTKRVRNVMPRGLHPILEA